MSEQEVRQASDRFYQALHKVLGGDPSDMEQLWSHAAGVSTMHPIGGNESGWEQVRGSWIGASQAIKNGFLEVSDLKINVLGDTAVVTGIEHGGGTIGSTAGKFDARFTNVFHKEAGEWKIVHHHSDLAPDLAAALGEMMAQHH